MNRKIKIPTRIVEQIPVLAEKIRKVFNKKIKKAKFLGFIDLSDEKHPRRYIGILAQEIFDAAEDEIMAKKTLAGYNHVLDAIFVYRSILDSKYGPIAIEHFLTHEIAHAIDRERVIKERKLSPKASGQRFVDKYCCQPTEFDAEMAAIEYVDMPYMKKNYAMLVATYLNSTSGYLGCWTRNKKLAKVFLKRLEGMLPESPL